MLSDVTSATRDTARIPADLADDFEWVNAWAASASPQVKPVPREPIPQGTALVQELAHLPAKTVAEPAPSAVASVPAAEARDPTPEPAAREDIQAIPAPEAPVAREADAAGAAT